MTLSEHEEEATPFVYEGVVHDMTMPNLTSKDLELEILDFKFKRGDEVAFRKSADGSTIEYKDNNGKIWVYHSFVMEILERKWIQDKGTFRAQYHLRQRDPPFSLYGRWVNEFELQGMNELQDKDESQDANELQDKDESQDK